MWRDPAVGLFFVASATGVFAKLRVFPSSALRARCTFGPATECRDAFIDRMHISTPQNGVAGIFVRVRSVAGQPTSYALVSPIHDDDPTLSMYNARTAVAITYTTAHVLVDRPDKIVEYAFRRTVVTHIDQRPVDAYIDAVRGSFAFDILTVRMRIGALGVVTPGDAHLALLSLLRTIVPDAPTRDADVRAMLADDARFLPMRTKFMTLVQLTAPSMYAHVYSCLDPAHVSSARLRALLDGRPDMDADETLRYIVKQDARVQRYLKMVCDVRHFGVSEPTAAQIVAAIRVHVL